MKKVLFLPLLLAGFGLFGQEKNWSAQFFLTLGEPRPVSQVALFQFQQKPSIREGIGLRFENRLSAKKSAFFGFGYHVLDLYFSNLASSIPNAVALSPTVYIDLTVGGKHHFSRQFYAVGEASLSLTGDISFGDISKAQYKPDFGAGFGASFRMFRSFRFFIQPAVHWQTRPTRTPFISEQIPSIFSVCTDFGCAISF